MDRDYFSLWLALFFIALLSGFTYLYYYSKNDFENQLPGLAESLRADAMTLDNECSRATCEKIIERYRNLAKVFDTELELRKSEKKVWGSFNKLCFLILVISALSPYHLRISEWIRNTTTKIKADK